MADEKPEPKDEPKDKPKSKKEWWEFGDAKRKPPAKAAKEMVKAAAGAKKGEAPKGEGSDEMKVQAMTMLMKPLSGLRHAMRTHPKKVLDNDKALEALKTMATDFEWAEGYGGEKYGKVVDAAKKLWNGDASGMQDLTQAGYNYDELAAKYGQLFGKGGQAAGPAAAEESKGIDDAINSIFA